MADLSPIETAGLAFAAHGVPASVAEAAARDAFASLARHRDDIARVLNDALMHGETSDGRPIWDAWHDDIDEHAVADAVLAYLVPTEEAAP